MECVGFVLALIFFSLLFLNVPVAVAIGAATMRTRINERGEVEVYPAIRLTLVYDRAGIDLLSAAKFLNGLALRLEQGGTIQ